MTSSRVTLLFFQSLSGRIAQTQTTDDDIQFPFQRVEPERRKLPLGFRKKARHQIFVAELYLKNFSIIQKGFHASTKYKVAKRRLLEPKLLNVHLSAASHA
jgi:hypothetical protein